MRRVPPALRPPTSLLQIARLDDELIVHQWEGQPPPLEALALAPESWLPDAFRRTVVVDGHQLRVLHDGKRVQGLSIGPMSGSVHRRPPVVVRTPPEEGVAVLTPKGEVLSRRGRVPAEVATMVQARSARLGVAGLQLEAEWLSGEREVVVVRWRPIERVPVPAFAQLTSAQLDVVQLASSGASVKEIAEGRACGVETVRSHLRGAYARLGVASRVELVPVAEEWDRWVRWVDGLSFGNSVAQLLAVGRHP